LASVVTLASTVALAFLVALASVVDAIELQPLVATAFA
jgi:hypothetical protein